MSTFGTAFCIDAPAEADVRAVHGSLRESGADAHHTDAFVTTAPDGLARLLVYVDFAVVGLPAERLLDHIGSGRAAVAQNHDEHGAWWSALRIADGACTTVHQHEVLPVDPTDPESVRGYYRELLANTPGEVDDKLVLRRPERDPEALDALARLYDVDPAAIHEAAAASDSAYQYLELIGNRGLFPFWFACGLPWPGRGPMLRNLS